MKKFITILFSGFYLMASVGIVVNVHYCGGKVKSIKILATSDSCCCVKKNVQSGCCDDKTYFFQLDKEDQINQNLRTLPESQLLTVMYPPSFTVGPVSIEEKNRYKKIKAPPPRNQALRLLHCSLTYYG